LSKQRVLQRALELADEVGIASLSMRNLGQGVGVEAMSLYNHVANKGEVLDGIVDLVMGEIDLPTIGSNWKKAMRRRALSAHEVLLRHPWATGLIVARPHFGPSMLRYVDATIGCLRAAGFSYRLADHAGNAIDSYVYGFTLQELSLPVAPESRAARAKALAPTIPSTKYPYLHGLSQQLIDGRHDGLYDFAFGLDLLLDGLERLRDVA
jgi:AcrR family transcriptional regulator